VVDAASRAALQKAGDRRSFAQRLQQLDLGVGQTHEYNRHAVLGLRQRRGDSRTQRVPVLGRRSRKVGYGDGDVIEASDHWQIPVLPKAVAS
jgi:hypothetical protein